MDNLYASWKKFLDITHNILFPKRCAGCRQNGSYLCLNCAAQMPLGLRPGDDANLAVAPYDHPAVRRLVWLLKYRGVKEIADIFADWIYEALIEDLADLASYREQNGKVLLVPVPLSAKRRHQRGFNQAEEIAARVAARDPVLFRLETKTLQKIRESPTQVSLHSRTERLKNLRGAFLVRNRQIFRGRTIILIDDVTTTGATLSSAAAAFTRARPRRVIKIAVAGR